MSLPGFTAESTVPGDSGRYLAARRQHRDSGEIVLAGPCFDLFIKCIGACGLSDACSCFCGMVWADCSGGPPPPCMLY
ncbi:hypothetical protein [Streptomyces sp. NPDC018031]|uniref:hypothetical protein n=1 Tax=Streptomyces sp. NPDC018031 TaxID=3365033 RepID=UPI0037BA1364